jgi:2-(1,2-epoxy-1,2-dihydrophenyl)acetyl-CoA isomerase
MSSTPANLLVERVGRVAVVVLQRPAFTTGLRTDLSATLEELACQVEVDALVLTGTGAAFVAGQDLDEHAAALASDPTTATRSLETEYGPIITRLADYPKPTVAAVNGVCAGGGLGLALACDLRVASATARFVPAFLDIRLAPDCGVSLLLGRAIGCGRARQLLLSGRAFTAAEAYDWGMVSGVVDRDDLRSAALARAEQLASAGAVVAATKQLLRAAEESGSLAAALSREGTVQAALAAAPEHASAVEALRSLMRSRA